MRQGYACYTHTRIYSHYRTRFIRVTAMQRAYVAVTRCRAYVAVTRCSHASEGFIVFRRKFLYGDGVAYHAEEYSPHKAALFAGLLKAFQR